MAGRYEMVEEPESLEIMDTDDAVYHPDQSIPAESCSPSVRSLEPLVSGPITLRMIFFDPRWSARQQRCCLISAGLMLLALLSLMIALLVGLGRVLTYIDHIESISNTGLQMFPEPEYQSIDVHYCRSGAGCPRNETILGFIKEINDALKAYRGRMPGAQDCRSGFYPSGDKSQPCRFDLAWLGPNCTAEKNYGYFDGQPCILLKLRNIKDWHPRISPATYKDLMQRYSDQTDRFEAELFYIPIICSFRGPSSATMSAPYGTAYVVFPDVGFNSSFVPAMASQSYLEPLAMVQVFSPDRYPQPLTVKCRIHADNIDDLEGVHDVSFDLLYQQQDDNRYIFEEGR